MAEHVDIPDGERHEPKGAASAISGQVLQSNGDTTTSFNTLDINDLDNLGASAVADADYDDQLANSANFEEIFA